MKSLSRLTLCLLLASALAGAARPAHGAPPADVQTATAERARLRADLDRVNAEIDALKRAGHDDSRLRARLADAEALARRLVDLDRRLGVTAAPAEPRPLPVAEPTDGPADLDAKADILADQARRIRAAADGLDRRAAEVKGRQELRRRAADLDRDPFAPLEGSKRRTVSINAPTTAAVPSGDHVSTPTPTPPSVPTGASGPGGTVAISAGSTPAQGFSGTPAGAPSPLATTSLSLSVELRDLLDPVTVADIGRLERGRAAAGSAAALQRAVAALRARAAAVDAQAASMRQAARKR